MTDTTPAQREAEGDETTTVEWDGVKVTFPASVEGLDLDALEAFEGGKAVAALKGMVGQKGYDTLRSDYVKANGRKPKAGDLGRLMDLVAGAFGFESQGE
jgi:hypothetical protein